MRMLDATRRDSYLAACIEALMTNSTPLTRVPAAATVQDKSMRGDSTSLMVCTACFVNEKMTFGSCAK